MRRGSVRGLNFGRRRKKINVPLLKEIGTWVIEIAIVLVISFVFVYFIGLRTTVVGQSMNPTIENGEEILKKDFEKIEWRRYEDSLIVPEPEPLISYILSCHGNQGQYILDHYKEFQSYVRKKTEGGFHITKDAGIFVGYIG